MENETKKYDVRIEGTAPLLQNRFAIEKTTETKGRKKQNPTIEEDCERALYKKADGTVFIPSLWLEASMVKAASDFNYQGKKTYKEFLKSGLVISPEEIPLEAEPYEKFVSRVVIQRAAIAKGRPKFSKWAASFTIEILDDILNPTVIKDILEAAGRFKGIGDWRPKYGRFKVVSFEKA